MTRIKRRCWLAVIGKGGRDFTFLVRRVWKLGLDFFIRSPVTISE